MGDSFKIELQESLTRDASVNELVEIICRHRDGGLSQRAAYEDLAELRGLVLELLGEDVEDRVLELMDIVTGWCAPHHRLWKEQLRT